MDIESTLVILKSGAIAVGVVGAIISRFEQRGFTIGAMELRTPTSYQWAEHYAEHEGKSFFEELVDRMESEGSVVVMEVVGINAIKCVRVMTGATDASDAAPGTIRGDFGTSVHNNIIHSSDSPVSATRELNVWFPTRVNPQFQNQIPDP